MVMRTALDPRSATSATGLMDETLGNAYATVRFVAENIEYIRHASAHMAEVYRVANSIENLDIVTENLALLEELNASASLVVGVAAQLTMLAQIQAALGAITSVAQRMPELLEVHENLSAILAEIANITQLNSRMTSVEGGFETLTGTVQTLSSDFEALEAVAGNMKTSVFDPRGIADDVFDRANHTGAVVPDDASVTMAKLADAVQMGVVVKAATKTALAALDSSKNKVAFLTENDREVMFRYMPGNFVAFINNDPEKGVYIPPAADTTGNSGAWVRVMDNRYVSPSWFGGKIQAAINFAAFAGIPTVVLAGNYVLTQTVQLRPNVHLWSLPGHATLTQANGTGLSSLVSWNTYSAHNAGIDGVVLDMNRAGNPDNAGHAALFALTIDNIYVKNCRILGSTGHGMLIQDCLRPVIDGNTIENCFVSGIYIYGVARTSQNNARITNNRVSKWGQHAIVTWNVQNSRVLNNDCIGYSQKTVCHLDNNLIAWVSGPKFDDVKPGEFIIGISGSGYFEALVLSKQGNTQLTVNLDLGDHFNIACVIGNGDVISISGSRDELIQGNTVIGGASLGISLFSTNEASMDRSKVIGNTVIGTMASGYSLQVANVAYYVRDNMFIGNTAIDTGLGGAAMDVNYRSGMTAVLGANGVRNIIDDNSWISYGSGMVDGLRVGANSGGVLVGNNQSAGVTEGIVGGASIALGAGWGTGASVANVFCYGDLIFFTVISGSSPAANPTITITHNALPLRRKRPSLQMTSAANAILPCYTYYPDPDYSSIFTVVGTPQAVSNGYQFVFRF